MVSVLIVFTMPQLLGTGVMRVAQMDWDGQCTTFTDVVAGLTNGDGGCV